MRIIALSYGDAHQSRNVKPAPLAGSLSAASVELEQVWRNAPVGLAVIDTGLRFVRINERLAEINGASVEAHLGRTVREMLPDLTEQGEALLRRVIESGEPLRDIEIAGETPAQPGVHRVWVEQFLPLRDASGAVVGVSVVAEEVTAQRLAQGERDRAEKRLRESEQRLAMALEAGQLGFWDTNLVTGHVMHGGQWAAMLGHSPDEIEPHMNAWRERVHPDDLERATALLDAHLEGRTPFYECEFRMRTRTGEWIWVLDRGRVVERDAQGRAVRAIGTHLDVTERRQAIEALHEADRRKDEFLAMLGHELRNPMAGLTTAVRVLSRDPGLGAPARQAAAIATRQLGQLRRLVDDLLDVSRITRGHVDLAIASLQVGEAVRASVDGVRPVCEARGHRVDVTPIDPALSVRADPVRLAQILDNLLSNACKFTPPGGTITVSARADGAEVELRVDDTGIGLEPGALESVFELFLQVEPGVGLAQGGLGIGLALVRQLAELHGGSARAESAGRGEGASFVVRLPRG
jgi:PAS domain S-box-containing protein